LAGSQRVLAVNAGSSSVKLSVVGAGDEAAGARELEAPDGALDVGALAGALSELGPCDAVGHRVVHGGERFREAVLIDAGVRAQLQALVELAPLHQPRSLAAIDAVCAQLPQVPAVACFDTAFHASMPAAASTYALPARWRERQGVRRYGFHGLSHAWVARRAPALLGREGDAALRIVSCHLGAGASLCAIADGRSLDTTMGFTPLEGLVMATRSGSVDPGLLLWLLEHTGMPERELGAALEHESGLQGLAGTPDMRVVLARADAGDEAAALALHVYLHRLRAAIAAMAAALGGVDALAFTGGVGERSAAVRAGAVEGLAFLGLAIDMSHNERAASGDTDVGRPEAAARTLVIAAREDLVIAGQTRAVLSGR